MTLSLSLVAIIALLAVPAAAAPQQELLEKLQRGIEKVQEGDLEEGLAEIQAVIEAEPRLAAAHFYAGQASAQMRRWQQAYDYFVAATEQLPGYGVAHVQACRMAYNLRDFDASYQHAVRAAQAGIDMTDAFAGLEAVTNLPDGWQQRLEAPRVLIGNIDTEALVAQGSSTFGGRQAEQGNAGADQRGVTTVEEGPVLGAATSAGAFPLGIGTSGAGLAAALQAEIHEVRRRFGEEMVRSEAFGVVSDQELANLVLYIKVDDVGEGVPRPLKGFVKLLDLASEQEVYSRPLELKNISSVSDLRNDIARYVGYMEEWLREQRR
jgi:tetratricopeptide (TPR) repeat protein